GQITEALLVRVFGARLDLEQHLACHNQRDRVEQLTAEHGEPAGDSLLPGRSIANEHPGAAPVVRYQHEGPRRVPWVLGWCLAQHESPARVDLGDPKRVPVLAARVVVPATR